jgi:hypothetical protein
MLKKRKRHHQISTNLNLAVRRSFTIHFILKTRHKISNAPGDVNKFNTSTFKTSNAPGDVRTNILRKLRNKCKTRNIFGQQTKEAHQHISFKSSFQQFLKPPLIPSLKKINDTSHLVQGKSSRTKHRDKTASSLIKSISINVFLPQG